MFGILELFDAGLEAGDGFTQKLCTRLTLAIIILAEILFLRTNTLLTRRFCAITALGQGGISTRVATTRTGFVTIFLFLAGQRVHDERGCVGNSGLYRPAAKTCLASLESGGSVAGWGRRIVVGHYRKIRRIR